MPDPNAEYEIGEGKSAKATRQSSGLSCSMSLAGIAIPEARYSVHRLPDGCFIGIPKDVSDVNKEDIDKFTYQRNREDPNNMNTAPSPEQFVGRAPEVEIDDELAYQILELIAKNGL